MPSARRLDVPKKLGGNRTRTDDSKLPDGYILYRVVFCWTMKCWKGMSLLRLPLQRNWLVVDNCILHPLVLFFCLIFLLIKKLLLFEPVDFFLTFTLLNLFPSIPLGGKWVRVCVVLSCPLQLHCNLCLNSSALRKTAKETEVKSQK